MGEYSVELDAELPCVQALLRLSTDKSNKDLREATLLLENAQERSGLLLVYDPQQVYTLLGEFKYPGLIVENPQYVLINYLRENWYNTAFDDIYKQVSA